MSVSTFSALCLVEFFNHDQVCLFVAGNDQLRNALAIIDNKVVGREVDEHYTHLATIVGIDGAWSIQHCQAVLQGKTTAGAYLCLVAFGQGDV